MVPWHKQILYEQICKDLNKNAAEWLTTDNVDTISRIVVNDMPLSHEAVKRAINRRDGMQRTRVISKRLENKVASKLTKIGEQAIVRYTALINSLTAFGKMGLPLDEGLNVLESMAANGYSVHGMKEIASAAAKAHENTPDVIKKRAAFDLEKIAAKNPSEENRLLNAIRTLAITRNESWVASKTELHDFANHYLRAVSSADHVQPVIETALQTGWEIKEAADLIETARAEGVKPKNLEHLVRKGAVKSAGEFSAYAEERKKLKIGFALHDYIALRFRHGENAKVLSPFARDPRTVETALKHAQNWNTSVEEYSESLSKTKARVKDAGREGPLEEFVGLTGEFHPQEAAGLLKLGIRPTSRELERLNFLKSALNVSRGDKTQWLLEIIRNYGSYSPTNSALATIARAEKAGVKRELIQHLFNKNVFAPTDELSLEKLRFHGEVENQTGRTGRNVNHVVLHELFPEPAAAKPTVAAAALSVYEFLSTKPQLAQHAANIAGVLGKSLSLEELQRANTQPFWRGKAADLEFAIGVADALKQHDAAAHDAWLDFVDRMQRPQKAKAPKPPTEPPKATAVSEKPPEINVVGLVPSEYADNLNTLLNFLAAPSKSMLVAGGGKSSMNKQAVIKQLKKREISNADEVVNFALRHGIIVQTPLRPRLSLNVQKNGEVTPVGKSVIDHVLAVLRSANRS